MRNKKRSVPLGQLAFLASVSVLTCASAVQAQSGEVSESQGQQITDGDIIVTARKRDETSISVPVTITAISGEEIQRRAISSLDTLARSVPSLMIGEGGGTVQGGIVAIRGISGAEGNSLSDQAVAFNVDGVAVARASVRRLGEMDMAQVEVLKGPQTLFFGKNSPAGIVSIKTADPTPNFQGKVNVGYEFNAREFRLDGYVAGPISDNLGFRLAGYRSEMKGWLRNLAPATVGGGTFGRRSSRAPDSVEYAVRGTLLWKPADNFSARLKISYSNFDGSAIPSTQQLIKCSQGAPQNGNTIDNCRADNTISTGALGPNFALVDPHFGDGRTYLKQEQILSGLELNFSPADDLNIASVSSFYDVKIRNVGNFTGNFLETGAPPQQILGAYNAASIRELTQELRMSSTFSGPVNFLVGTLYQDSRADAQSLTFRNALNPGARNAAGQYTNYVGNTLVVQNGVAYSVFGQAAFTFLRNIELSVGGRYSHERKKIPVYSSAGNAGQSKAPQTLVEVDGPARAVSFDNFSPEITLTYRPSRNLTLYSSYKKGFLSGGYNSSAPVLSTPDPLPATGRFLSTTNPSYDQMTIRGFEAGVKAAIAGGKLRLNLAAYSYVVGGLQVSSTIRGTQTELRNAASATSRGVDFDMRYQTPLRGLVVNGAISYNRGRYKDYQASCYRGQSSTQCFNQLNRLTGQIALLQDLSNTQLVRAPAWVGNAGFEYRTDVGSNLKVTVGGNTSFSGSYISDSLSTPAARQRSYALFDASIALAQRDDKWAISLIGRNLTDRYYVVRTTDAVFSGSAPGGAVVGRLGDTVGAVSRGRELMVRASVGF